PNFHHDIDESNTVGGKPIFYKIGLIDQTFDENDNFGYLGLISCTNITVKNLDVNGIVIVDTTDSTISNVSSCNNTNGIYLYISSDNIIINCTAYNNDYGIHIHKSSNNNITNCNVYDNKYHGIYIPLSSYNNIANCNVYNNNYNGIFLIRSLNCTLRNNTIYNNTYNFDVDTLIINEFHHDIDATNTVNGKRMYYLADRENEVFDGTIYDFGYMALISCTNITVKNSDVCGILLADTTDSTVSNISSHNNVKGVSLWFSSGNSITNCDVCLNKYGIFLNTASNNIITNCDAYNNGYG
ncbi:unnamed protein product, partial [marine sediment metagenome]